VVEDDALASLKGDTAAVLAAAADALETVADWRVETVQQALQDALVTRMGLKPRLAFGPVRVATSGRRVSPPLFESLALLGRDETLARITRLAATLA
jgi:glutamyl-tRNA synthetase